MMLGHMCVVLQVLFRSAVLQVLGRTCVVLQVLELLQVLRQVLGLGRGRGRGGAFFAHHCSPTHKTVFCQFRATPEPQNKYILNDTGTTPEGKKRYLPGMISERYGIYMVLANLETGGRLMVMQARTGTPQKMYLFIGHACAYPQATPGTRPLFPVVECVWFGHGAGVPMLSRSCSSHFCLLPSLIFPSIRACSALLKMCTLNSNLPC